jgi:hypothetical protein
VENPEVEMDQLERVFNQGEAVLWSAFAIGLLLVATRRSGRKRRLLLIAGGAFGAFGFSDYIEAGTGAWWDPPWLLALKGACIAVLLFTLREWRRLPQRGSEVPIHVGGNSDAA